MDGVCVCAAAYGRACNLRAVQDRSSDQVTSAQILQGLLAQAMYVVLSILMQVVRGDHFIIADYGNDRLQLCDAASPGGPCETVASVTSPRSVTVDNAGDYIVATGYQIKRCPSASPDAGCEVAVGWEHSGDGDTELYNPGGVFWDPWRFYVIADTSNHRVQRCVATVLHARCHTVTDDLY